MHSQTLRSLTANTESEARQALKALLAQVPESHHLLFKRMYSHTNLELPINEVVDNIPKEKLDWALFQVENGIKKINSND